MIAENPCKADIKTVVIALLQLSRFINVYATAPTIQSCLNIYDKATHLSIICRCHNLDSLAS